MTAAETHHRSQSIQLLTFALGDEAYAIDILKVQEIKSAVAITPLPNSPRELRGVINLRGAVVPIVDLRRRLQLPELELTRHSVIIVTRVFDRIVGLAADSVSDVLTLPIEAIQPPPPLEGSAGAAQYLAGLARVGERLIVLLDLERTLGELVKRTP